MSCFCLLTYNHTLISSFQGLNTSISVTKLLNGKSGQLLGRPPRCTCFSPQDGALVLFMLCTGGMSFGFMKESATRTHVALFPLQYIHKLKKAYKLHMTKHAPLKYYLFLMILKMCVHLCNHKKSDQLCDIGVGALFYIIACSPCD